jgi:hypothetical protein
MITCWLCGHPIPTEQPAPSSTVSHGQVRLSSPSCHYCGAGYAITIRLASMPHLTPAQVGRLTNRTS